MQTRLEALKESFMNAKKSQCYLRPSSLDR